MRILPLLLINGNLFPIETIQPKSGTNPHNPSFIYQHTFYGRLR